MSLFSPCTPDGPELKNRLAMTPMTRCRAFEENAQGLRCARYRISLHFLLQGMADTDPQWTFSRLAKDPGGAGMEYPHLVEEIGGNLDVVRTKKRISPLIRAKFNGPLIPMGATIRKKQQRTSSRDLLTLSCSECCSLDTPICRNGTSSVHPTPNRKSPWITPTRQRVPTYTRPCPGEDPICSSGTLR